MPKVSWLRLPLSPPFWLLSWLHDAYKRLGLALRNRILVPFSSLPIFSSVSWAAWTASHFLTFILVSLPQRATVLRLVRLILQSNMVSAFLILFIIFLAISAPVSGQPTVTRPGYYRRLRQESIQPKSLAEAAGSFPDINVLVEGNKRFRNSIVNSSNPNVLQGQTEDEQSPGFLFLGYRCVSSDESPGYRH